MAISIDHIAVPCREPEISARFFGDILGVAISRDGADDEFFCLRFDRGACLLYTEMVGHIEPHHFALRVSEDEFASVVSRLRARAVPFGNDPEDLENAQTTDALGGRGRVYFRDPNGHLLEVCA